jgi:hypothetical protein
VNLKTHNFWAYRWFIDRLEDVCEECDITSRSNQSPRRGQVKRVLSVARGDNSIRHEDSVPCLCGFEVGDTLIWWSGI